MKKFIAGAAFIAAAIFAAVIIKAGLSPSEQKPITHGVDTDASPQQNVTDYGDTREFNDKDFGVSITLPEGYSVGSVNNDSKVRYFESKDGKTKVNIMWSNTNYDKFIEARQAENSQNEPNVSYKLKESLDVDGRHAYRETFVTYDEAVPEFAEAHYIYYVDSGNDNFVIIDFCESNGNITSLDYDTPYDAEFLESVKTLKILK